MPGIEPSDSQMLDARDRMWHCPACESLISHSSSEFDPRRGVRYRCQICRLELVPNEQTNRLDLTPI
jgi:hypothetical protein